MTPVELHYCYDARDQLIARNSGAGCDTGSDEAYTYDAAGNRLTASDGSGTRTFGYTADGQYTGASHDASDQLMT
jgi:YD repeat-containing protein